MITIEQIDTTSTSQTGRFLDVPHQLYANCAQWVPPLSTDAALQLNRSENPFFDQAEADFFIAVQEGRDVGRIAVFAPKNNPNGEAKFYLFDSVNDHTVASALFDCAFEWVKTFGLKTVIGPQGFNPFLDASGLLIEGFAYRQVMSSTTYNYAYYVDLVESQGFIPQQDTITCHRDVSSYQGPTWLYGLADKISQNETYTVLNFTTVSEMQTRILEILNLFQQTTGGGLQNASQATPDRDLFFIMNSLLRRGIDPRLIKAVAHDNQLVGILFGFPNLSDLFQQNTGQSDPDIGQQAISEANGIIVNGLAFLPEFEQQGLSLLLFVELEKTVREMNFQYGDIVRIADKDQALRRNLNNLGLQPTQKHRIYVRHL